MENKIEDSADLSSEEDIATENAEILDSQPRQSPSYVSTMAIIVFGILALLITELLLPYFTPLPNTSSGIIPIQNTSNNQSLVNSTPCAISHYNTTTNTVTLVQTRCETVINTTHTFYNYITPELIWSIIMGVIALILYPMLDKERYPSSATIYLFVFSLTSAAIGVLGISGIFSLGLVWWILYNKRLISTGLMNP